MPVTWPSDDDIIYICDALERRLATIRSLCKPLSDELEREAESLERSLEHIKLRGLGA